MSLAAGSHDGRADTILTNLLRLARAAVAFVAASGFLFGQLFFGVLEWHAMLAGCAGLLAVLASLRIDRGGRLVPLAAILACAAALVGVGIDAQDYYSRYRANSGSYYPWVLMAPFILGLLVIAGSGIAALRGNRRHGTG